MLDGRPIAMYITKHKEDDIDYYKFNAEADGTNGVIIDKDQVSG